MPPMETALQWIQRDMLACFQNDTRTCNRAGIQSLLMELNDIVSSGGFVWDRVEPAMALLQREI